MHGVRNVVRPVHQIADYGPWWLAVVVASEQAVFGALVQPLAVASGVIDVEALPPRSVIEVWILDQPQQGGASQVQALVVDRFFLQPRDDSKALSVPLEAAVMLHA